jgi:flagellar protein FlaI
MPRLIPQIQSIFSHIPLFSKGSRLLSDRNKLTLKNIIKEFVKPYVEQYRLEHVELEEVLYAYELRGGVRVKIGTRGCDVLYVVEEPEVSLEDIDHAVDWVLERVLQGELVANPRSIVSWNLSSLEDYLYFKIVSGLGPIAPLILDPYIEDVYVSRDVGRVFVVNNKLSWTGWLKTNIMLEPSLVDRVVVSISRRIGKHISQAYPLSEGAYGGYLRVSLIYGEAVSTIGSSLVIRKKSTSTWTITRLIEEGTLDKFIAAYLWLLLEERGWVIIAGHVGSGKTTLLQALLTLIPPGRKVIAIEDTPELSGSTGIWEQLIEKTEVFTRESQIDSYTLLKFALRRRPDYIVIGEVRGVEARLLVQASRLGHGVLNTIHADTPESVIKRLMAPPISIPRNLLNNIWSIVVVGVDPKGKRGVLALAEVDEKAEPVYILKNPDSEVDPVEIAKSSVRLKRGYIGVDLQAEIERRALFLEKITEKGVFEIENLVEELSRFYSKGLELEELKEKEARVAG